jgi:alkylation response protein AidB-like acyl-CoA dehydrogenase
MEVVLAIAINEDHRELEAVSHGFLQSRGARAAGRALLESEDERLPDFWDELVQLGWLGLHLPEQYGGSGCGLPELVVVVEQLGRAVAPGPFVPTVIVSAVISALGDKALRDRLLMPLASGQATGAFGMAGSLSRSGGLVDGCGGVVLGAGLASVLLLAVGDDLVVVDADDPGVRVEVPANVDPTRRCGRVTVHRVAVPEANVLPGARAHAEAIARTILAAEATGGARECVDMAAAYAKQREQFGRPIGAFQAVKHHCANMLVVTEKATAAVWDAARAAAGRPDEFELASAAAVTLAVPGFHDNAQLNIQVHGGIGYTWEHDAHMLLRRAMAIRAIVDADQASEDITGLARMGVQRRPGIDLPPSSQAIRDEVRAVATELASLDAQAQRRRLIDTGYAMPHWPKPWGRAADAVEQLIIDAEFAAAGIVRPDYSITGWVIFTLIQYGTDDQIRRWVRPALEGDEVWCQLFSEPEAGSDAAGIKTRAVRVEGGWLLNGQKVWSTGAHLSSRGFATVRTDPEAPKHAGITTLVVDMSAPGVQVRPFRQITGAVDFNEVFLDDVFVPDQDVVGPPNQGWKVARATFGHERVSIGDRTSTAAIEAIDLLAMIEHLGDRLAGVSPRVGRLLADEHALQLLNLRRVERAVAGGEPGPEGNVTKLLRAEILQHRTALAAAIAGQDAAFLDGSGGTAARQLLGSRRLSIAGGTSEITRNQIGERILGLPRDPLMR